MSAVENFKKFRAACLEGDPGIEYLRKTIRNVEDIYNPSKLVIHSSEDKEFKGRCPLDKEGLEMAVQVCLDVCGFLKYSFHGQDNEYLGGLFVLFDGAYTVVTAEEIINDYSVSLDEAVEYSDLI